MKHLILLLTWWVSTVAAAPLSYQDVRTDSLKKLLITAPPDSNRVMMLTQLAYEYTQTDPLFTISYGRQALQLAQQLRFKSGEGWALVRLGSGFREAGNYPAALQMGQQGLVIAEELHNAKMTARALNALGYLYWEQGNSRPALACFFRAKAVAEKNQNVALLTRVMGNIGNVYVQLNRLDSALIYSQRGYALDLSQHDLTSEVGDAAMLGNIHAGLGNYALAGRYYRSSIRRATGQRFTFALCRAYLGQARLLEHQAAAVTDSVLYFGQQALAAGQLGQYPKGILQASQFLAAAHAARRDTAAAFRYLTLASTTRDSLFSRTKMAQIQALDVSERLRQQEAADRENAAASERRYYWLLAVLASTVPALLLLWRNNRHKQQANRQLNAQNAEIASQRDTLSNTITQLHATQAQLVQSEKMAFLGELTAGIAHELQNPLAFVKNFAEVSTVLVDDMGEDGVRRRPHDPNRDLLLAGLKQNLREISEHGQRATTIIADMLARSRQGSAPHVPTDINSLIDEYLRLAYQGLRAKHPSFHAARVKHLEAGLCPVPAVAADLGRVLLNLFTNAFYAVQQRQMLADESYVAEVRVTTRQLASKHIEIRIYDNGPGIPAEVVDKIFQPFFTTKPAHEGTGLGLSISHDIVTQSHSGTLTVDSQEGAGTEFIICLPCPPAL